MVIYTYLLLLLLRLASAASIQPSNDTLPTLASPLELIYTSTGGMTVTAVLAPLTSQIGIGQSLTALNSVNIQGTLQAVSAHSQDIVTSSDIAYISCDPNTNTSNISPTDIVTQLIGQVPNVKAILLYSFIAPHCNISGSFPYTTILSMTSVQDARTLLGIIDMSMTPTNATIMDQASASATSSASGSSPTETTQPSANSTPAPTTAVAMSILYSITGIITLLFLVIIATGAIRAHRHPERYGPRGGVPGRPRQSRAKGLARAMLETLPIVKFGDGDVKSESPAVELEEGASEHHQHDVAIPPVHAVGGETPIESTGDVTVHDTGIGPDENQHTHGEGSQAGSHVADEHLGCSICTEDFEKGEDVRVLPCNHKFHPACIDPWLLNVSGTCPLCRIDLRPAETNTAETEETAEGDTAERDTALPPPLTETEGADTQAQPARGRLSRRIDAAFMRNASSPERLAALRQLREQQLEAGITAVGADAEREEQSRRARLTGRLRDAFRIRTRPMPEPAAQISEPATGPVRTAGLEETL